MLTQALTSMTTTTTTATTTTAVPSPHMAAATTGLSTGGLVVNRWNIHPALYVTLISTHPHQVDNKVMSANAEKSGGYDDEQACLQAFDAVTTGLAMFATRSSEDMSMHLKWTYADICKYENDV